MKHSEKRKCLVKRWHVVAIMVIVTVLGCWYGNHHLIQTFYTYQNNEIPVALQGFRIVQVSDLHDASFGKDNQKLCDSVAALSPDIIVITGDIIDSNRPDMEHSVNTINSLAAIAPTYYVNGNHETWLSQDTQERLYDSLSSLDNVTILWDTTMEIEKDGMTFQLLGVCDEHLQSDTLRRMTEELETSQFTILLAHEPQYLDEYSHCGIDLVLTGHAHGGQFRLPFIGGVVAPDQGLFPVYTEGMHTLDSTSMIISRGLGNSIIPVRLFNDPELVVIDLAAE